MTDGEFQSESLEGGQRITEVLRLIMATLLKALNEGAPFMITGVVIRNGNIIEPIGLSCGDPDRLRDMIPSFHKNNDFLFKHLDQESAEKKAASKYVTAEISQQADGNFSINFKK